MEFCNTEWAQKTRIMVLPGWETRSSADADNLRNAFRGQSRSTIMVPFWVRCNFLLSMWPAPRVTTV